MLYTLLNYGVFAFMVIRVFLKVCFFYFQIKTSKMNKNIFFCFFVTVVLTKISCYPLQAGDNHLHFKSDQRDVKVSDFECNYRSPRNTFCKSPVASVTSSFKCTMCKYAIDIALWKYKTPDKSYKGLFKSIINHCINLHIESSEICSGMVLAMKNETQYVLANVEPNGEMICGLIFPSTCKSKDLSWNKNWIIGIPKKQYTPPIYPKKKITTLRVLQMSDIHIDLKYTPGSKVNCKDPLCCRQPVENGDVIAGYWGSHGYCDSPYWLVENFFQHASKEHFDYIIWTGDLPAHDVWNQSRSEQLFLLNNLTTLLLKYFPNTPIYPALGNHESYPVNSFPPHYVTGYNDVNWLYDFLQKAWKPWLTADALSTVKQSGFYTMLVKPGFRIISLNMNYCNNQNFWMLKDPRDPNGELQWLIDTLLVAEKNSEFVHIIGHIPPINGGDCLKVWRNNYYAIVARFRDIIKGQFFGHTHKDEIQILYTNSTLQKPIMVSYIGPSITTYYNLNPGYRVYKVDMQTYDILDHETYILNLTKANQPNSAPEWELEYTAKSAYNLSSLSPTSWDNLFKSWLEVKNGQSNTLFGLYYKYLYKSYPPSETCDGICKKKLLCGIPAGNFTTSQCPDS